MTTDVVPAGLSESEAQQRRRPAGPEIPVVTVASVVRFLVLRACWRHDVLERLLGLPRPLRTDAARAA